MTAPVIAASATTIVSDPGTGTFTINLPSGIAAGDLLLGFFEHYNAPSYLNTPSGWTSCCPNTVGTGQSYMSNDNNQRGGMALKVADGTEGTTIAWPAANSGGTVAAVIHRITGFQGVAAVCATTGGNPTAMDPGGVVCPWPSSTSVLWLAAVGWRDAGSITADPTGYSNAVQGGTGAGAQTTMYVVSKTGTGNTEDPSAFTNSQARFYTCFTVGVAGAGGSGQHSSVSFG